MKLKNKGYDFNEVVDLYISGDIEKGCELLSENIWTFIDQCKTININSCDRLNIQQWALMRGHEAILKSIDRGYEDYGKIYNYVRIRIVGGLKNLFLKNKRDKDKIVREYSMDFDNCEMMSDYGGIDDTKELIHWYYLRNVIFPKLIELTDDEKTVIYNKYYNFPGITFKDLSEIMGISAPRVSKINKSALSKIKDYLLSKNIDDENIITR